MFIAAIAHHYAFSYKPFMDEAASRPSYCESFWSMFDMRDIHQETLEHAGDAKIKLAEYGRRLRNLGAGAESGENIPLLEVGSLSTAPHDSHRNASRSQPIDIQQSGNEMSESTWVGGDRSEDVENQADEKADDIPQRKHYNRASYQPRSEILSVKDFTVIVGGKDSAGGKQVSDTAL